jgi:hypothetical protein
VTVNLLRLILDICLLRGKPQDLPTSGTLALLAAAASVVVDYLSLPDHAIDLGRLLFVVSQVALFGAALWLLLRQRGYPERWTQTVTALYAANAVFSLMLLPFLPALAEMVRQGAAAGMGWQGYVSLALTAWFLAVMARVLREALELGMLASFLVSLAVIFVVRILGLVLAPLFGLTGAV